MKWSGWTPFEIAKMREDLTPFGEGRHPGRHISQILKRMKIAAGENVSAIPGEQDFLRPAVGFMWEYALELVAGGMTLEDATEMAMKRVVLKQRQHIVKQLRLELESTHGTPDALDPGWTLINDTDACLESYKATWRSCRKAQTMEGFADNFWAWQMQEKAYCKMAGLLKCRWIVLWVCGDYSRPIGPRTEQCMFTWTQQELDDNWNALMMHADEMDEETQT